MASTPSSPGDVTMLLQALNAGEADASDSLIRLVYDELRIVAARQLRSESSGHTLRPTALVHEAYLRLVDQRAELHNRSHFFAIAAQAMRRVLMDHARRRKAQRRGGGLAVTLRDAHLATQDTPIDMLALDAALDKLARDHERPARAVELRYFGGLSAREAGEILGVSAITVKRDWRFARAFLYRELGGP